MLHRMCTFGCTCRTYQNLVSHFSATLCARWRQQQQGFEHRKPCSTTLHSLKRCRWRSIRWWWRWFQWNQWWFWRFQRATWCWWWAGHRFRRWFRWPVQVAKWQWRWCTTGWSWFRSRFWSQSDVQRFLDVPSARSWFRFVWWRWRDSLSWENKPIHVPVAIIDVLVAVQLVALVAVVGLVDQLLGLLAMLVQRRPTTKTNHHHWWKIPELRP